MIVKACFMVFLHYFQLTLKMRNDTRQGLLQLRLRLRTGLLQKNYEKIHVCIA